jgi:hypothetical protein
MLEKGDTDFLLVLASSFEQNCKASQIDIVYIHVCTYISLDKRRQRKEPAMIHQCAEISNLMVGGMGGPNKPKPIRHPNLGTLALLVDTNHSLVRFYDPHQMSFSESLWTRKYSE